MNKKEMIKEIFDSSKIHHNITINFRKAQDAISKVLKNNKEQEGFNQDMWIESMLINDFVSEFENEKMNDSGNRNLCNCRKEYPRNIKESGACRKHDLWHIYQYGRSGATLYWDKYWSESNSGFFFKYQDYELEEMTTDELAKMIVEINIYNKMVRELMDHYYEELTYQAEQYKEEMKAKEKQEKYDAMVAPYNVNLFELSKSDQEPIKRNALSLIKLLKIK